VENSPLEPLLALAVPLWIEKLRHKSFEDFEKRREKILKSVCYKGDLLLYGSKKKGETAQLFNDLAEGLAWLALIAKGGVTFGDQSWDAEFATMPNMQQADQGASQSEAVPPVREGIDEAAEVNIDAGAGSTSETVEREKASD
jgi:hypothetical protein